MKGDRLAPRQKAFAEAYVACGNAAEAARQAGYQGPSVRRTGVRNLQNPKVAAYINDLMQQVSSERIAGAEEVLEHLTSAMRGEITEEEIVTVNGKAQRMRRQINPRDRLKAAELLGKRYGLYTEKLDVKEDSVITVKVEYGD